MPRILVHGVADTAHSFDRLVAHLDGEDARPIYLPGFASPLPEGFAASKEAYVDWLIQWIEASGAPVDLVGHDWGCILTARVASLRPDLVRSWVGMSGAIDADYVWHDLARLWQTPILGEAVMTALRLIDFEKTLKRFGVPAEDARKAVRRIDGPMKSAILKLYRSATHVGREWEADLGRVSCPALILWGLSDPFVPHRFADRLGAATGARKVIKVSAGHWPHLERPAEVARELTAFWTSLQPVASPAEGERVLRHYPERS